MVPRNSMISSKIWHRIGDKTIFYLLYTTWSQLFLDCTPVWGHFTLILSTLPQKRDCSTTRVKEGVPHCCSTFRPRHFRAISNLFPRYFQDISKIFPRFPRYFQDFQDFQAFSTLFPSFLFLFNHHFYSPAYLVRGFTPSGLLLDKPWSQVSTLLPPGTVCNWFIVILRDTRLF